MPITVLAHGMQKQSMNGFDIGKSTRPLAHSEASERFI